jgi:hypothetical protein
MTLRQELKRCLIEGWLTSTVCQCAAMVMIDHGIRWGNDAGKISGPLAENFLHDICMPPFPDMQVSVYIAAFYPKTSAALFQKNKNALQIFWREKQRKPNRERTLYHERVPHDKENASIKYIKLRSLSKKHDWNTVK